MGETREVDAPVSRKQGAGSAAEWSSHQKLVELENLLEIDGPSVLECFHAVEQAKEAIREAAMQEENVSSPAVPEFLPTPDHLPGTPSS